VVPVYLYEELCKELEMRRLLEAAQWQVVETLNVLWKMRQRGICIDEEALNEFRKELDRQLIQVDAELQDIVPDGIKNIHPLEGYKNLPKNTTGMVLRDFPLNEAEIATVKKKIEKGGKLSYGVYQVLTGEKVLSEPSWYAQRYCKILPFKTSTQQMQKLMMHLGDEVPVDHKTKRPTTGKKFLKELKGRVYAISIQHREIKKMVGTYAAWPVKNGMIHPILTLKPRSGRLSCKHPNFQNITQPGDEEQDLTRMAHKFRQVITARPNHVLNRRDYNAIEAVLTGYFADDEDYMKLAALSIYAWVTGKQTGEKMPEIGDPALGPVLQKIKKKDKVLYKKFKTCVLGIGYGLGPKNMHIANPGVFTSWPEAAKLRRYILGLFPKIQKWQVSTVARARIQHYVQGPLGNIRWFWDIPGADNNKSMAQNPQGTAAGIIKRAMLKIDKSPIGYMLVGQIHDELIMDFPESTADECDEVMRVIMESPIPELGGLVIPTERTVGRTLDG
jgi:DNA polymerase I-like protein with 3'-5' exonuclease and polymerase domains